MRDEADGLLELEGLGEGGLVDEGGRDEVVSGTVVGEEPGESVDGESGEEAGGENLGADHPGFVDPEAGIRPGDGMEGHDRDRFEREAYLGGEVFAERPTKVGREEG